jgi:hypothetical protein
MFYLLPKSLKRGIGDLEALRFSERFGFRDASSLFELLKNLHRGSGGVVLHLGPHHVLGHGGRSIPDCRARTNRLQAWPKISAAPGLAWSESSSFMQPSPGEP